MDQPAFRITLREKGQITLPTVVRRALRIDAGDDIELQIVEGGQVMLRGMKMIPADQAWFWTDSWQKGEQEASDEIAAHRVETFKDDDSFLQFIAPSGAEE